MKKWWSKRWFRWISVLLILFILLVMLRNPMMRGLGHWLVARDELVKTETCFVLGGNSYERGMEAVRVYQRFNDHRFVCTGGNYPLQIRALLDTAMSEAELTQHLMLHQGVPASSVAILEGSRSTMDESVEILDYCRLHNLTDITVISSAFHLRRVRWVFEDKFRDAGIRVHFHGVHAEEYDTQNWWHHEEGLIMANNEVVKLFYYLLKY